MSEQDLMPAEAVTVILSEAGWIRCAKGHDIDVGKLNFRAGDQYLSSAQGKSNQKVYVLDETGRSYALSISSLPSARGLGEPLSSKLSPANGVGFRQPPPHPWLGVGCAQLPRTRRPQRISLPKPPLAGAALPPAQALTRQVAPGLGVVLLRRNTFTMTFLFPPPCAYTLARCHRRHPACSPCCWQPVAVVLAATPHPRQSPLGHRKSPLNLRHRQAPQRCNAAPASRVWAAAR